MGRVSRTLDRLIGVPAVAALSRLAPHKEPAEERIRKILLIKLAAVGDTVLLSGTLRALRRALPDATIHWLVSPINQAIARMIPGVDEVKVLPRSALAATRFCLGLRRERYDAVIDGEQWARMTALIAYFTRAPVRIGFSTPGQKRDRLFTRVFEKSFRQHESHDFLCLFSRLVPLEQEIQPELAETELGRAELEELCPTLKLDSSVPRVLLHPGCGADGLPREWPLANYAVLGKWIRTAYKADLFLSSGPEESKKTSDLKRLLSGQAIDLGGRLSWPATVSLVSRMDLVVSGNTGVMHVAAALGKKQVALHGPTNAEIWGPLNPNARVIKSPCPDCPCLRLGFEYHTKDQRCMARIEIDDARTAISALFDNAPVTLRRPQEP